MKVRKITPESYIFDLAPIDERDVFYLWCDDGWTYIPELSIRRRYFTTSKPDVLRLEEEHWEGVVPLAESLEKVHLTLYSSSPRIWKEVCCGLCEIYEEQITTPSKNK